MPRSVDQKTILDRAVGNLKLSLGPNLLSCCLYGSAVRGNLHDGVSDLNLLILLEASDPAAHERVAEAIGGMNDIDPFVLGRAGFERSVRAFAAKFASIKRNYRVLHGVDPLADVDISATLERFLCEQALRNLRLRMVFAYVTRERQRNYSRFLIRSVTPMFLRFSEVLRLEGMEVPLEFEDRLRLFEATFGIDAGALRELLAAKIEKRTISAQEATEWHERVFPVVDTVTRWIEARWGASEPA